jgi:hypothetical protein
MSAYGLIVTVTRDEAEACWDWRVTVTGEYVTVGSSGRHPTRKEALSQAINAVAAHMEDLALE